MPVPGRPWEQISTDLITGLPLVDGYDAIVTFVCHFTKMAHFVPVSKTISAKGFAKVYLDHVYRLHGLSKVIISDRDPRFTSHYYQSLMRGLRTRLNISSAYHPQTDGATERVHRTIESILRGYCYNQHNTWLAHLSLAEFSYNNTKHASTGFSPFEVQYGYAPRTPAEFITPPGAEDPDILRNIKDIHSLVEENLKFAKAAQKHHADKRTKPLEFEVDDWVLLSTENLSLPSQPCKKLRQRFVGPYKIIEKISSQAYRLQLPADLKIHDVFHIRLLRKYDHDGASPPFSDVLPAHRAEIDNLDDLDYIKRILMHDIQFAPHLYKNGEALVFQVEWEEDRDISWEPFAKVFRTDEYAEYARSEFYQNFLASDSYKQLWAQYPHRGPKPPQPNLSIIEPVGV